MHVQNATSQLGACEFDMAMSKMRHLSMLGAREFDMCMHKMRLLGMFSARECEMCILVGCVSVTCA